MLDTLHIKEVALKVGFDLCGVAECRHLASAEVRFRHWLSEGRQSSLGYMERNIEKRFNPTLLVEGARTAVVCGVSHKNRFSGAYPSSCRTKVASYACAREYHLSIREMLDELFEQLRDCYPELRGRSFVDTAPLAEKLLAADAGLGWIGRNTLLVTPDFGSYVSLGALLLCDKSNHYDKPLHGVGCGECRRCVDSCPTGALELEGGVDTRRCIACHTIEREQESRIDLHGWIFGCDECQSSCPYNIKAREHLNPRFDPLFDPLAMDVATWCRMTDEEFSETFGHTSLTRSGRERIVSNILDE